MNRPNLEVELRAMPGTYIGTAAGEAVLIAQQLDQHQIFLIFNDRRLPVRAFNTAANVCNRYINHEPEGVQRLC